ncbi:hypothetical protein HDV01_003711 [Terramyces sp. JEL0728]|nr:hypothetical protein HDV01_003711 [Terramyces sp. JEL0728]
MTTGARKERSDKGTKRGRYHSWTPEEKQIAITFHNMGKSPQWIQQNKLPGLTTSQISKQLDNLRVRKEIATGAINPPTASNLEDMLDSYPTSGGDITEVPDESGEETDIEDSDFAVQKAILGNLVFVNESSTHMHVWVNLLPGMECVCGPIEESGVRMAMKFPCVPKSLIAVSTSYSEEGVTDAHNHFEDRMKSLKFIIPSSQDLSQSTDGFKEWRRSVKIDGELTKWILLRVEFSSCKRVKKTYDSTNYLDFPLVDE